MLNQRQIILLAAFCLPLFALILVSYTGVEEKQVPRLHAGRVQRILPPPRPLPPALVEAREKTRTRLREATALTQEEYTIMRRNDPSLPSSIDVYRAHLQGRLTQLEIMKVEQWDTEQHSSQKH